MNNKQKAGARSQTGVRGSPSTTTKKAAAGARSNSIPQVKRGQLKNQTKSISKIQNALGSASPKATKSIDMQMQSMTQQPKLPSLKEDLLPVSMRQHMLPVIGSEEAKNITPVSEQFKQQLQMESLAIAQQTGLQEHVLLDMDSATAEEASQLFNQAAREEKEEDDYSDLGSGSGQPRKTSSVASGKGSGKSKLQKRLRSKVVDSGESGEESYEFPDPADVLKLPEQVSQSNEFQFRKSSLAYSQLVRDIKKRFPSPVGNLYVKLSESGVKNMNADLFKELEDHCLDALIDDDSFYDALQKPLLETSAKLIKDLSHWEVLILMMKLIDSRGGFDECSDVRGVMTDMFLKYSKLMTANEIWAIQTYADVLTKSCVSAFTMSMFSDNNYQKHMMWPSVATLLVFGGTRIFRSTLVSFEPTRNFSFAKKNFSNAPASYLKRQTGKTVKTAYHVWWAYHVAFPNLTANALQFVLSEDNYEYVCHSDFIFALNKSAQHMQLDILMLIKKFCFDASNAADELIEVMIKLKESKLAFSNLNVRAEAVEMGKMVCSDLVELFKLMLNQTDSVALYTAISESTDLYKLKLSLERDIVRRSAVNLTDTYFQQQIFALVEADELQTQVSKMNELSKRIASENGYAHNAYQCYLAAKLVHSTHAWNVLKLSPGQGKSFIMILMAVYYHQHQQKSSVFITSEELLRQQLQMHIDANVPDGKQYIFVYTTTSVIEARDQHNDSIFFIDEGDIFIRDHLVTVEVDYSVSGLMCLEQKQVYLFTATLPPELRCNLIDALTGAKVRIVQAKPSLAYTKAGVQDVNNFVGSAYKDEQDCLDQLYCLVQTNARLKPIIIFVTKLNNEIVENLASLAQQQEVDFKHVNNAEAAMMGKGISQTDVTGVFLVSTEFARGYDLKLAIDALVIITDLDQSLVMSTAEQMAGRASRAQTVQYCHVLLVDAFLHSSKPQIKKVLTMRETGKEDDTGKIIRLLLALLRQPYLTTKIKKSVDKIREHGIKGWLVSLKSFDKSGDISKFCQTQGII